MESKIERCLLGVLAEKLIVKYLQNQYNQVGDVVSEPFTTYDTHVDIKINWSTGDPTTIEVRSSFAYDWNDNMSKVVGKIFDHLGNIPLCISHTSRRKTTIYVEYCSRDREKIPLATIKSIHSTLPAVSRIIGLRKIGQIKRGSNMDKIDLETAERLLVEGEQALYNTIPIPQGWMRLILSM